MATARASPEANSVRGEWTKTRARRFAWPGVEQVRGGYCDR